MTNREKYKVLFIIIFLVVSPCKIAIGTNNNPEDIVKKHYQADLDGARLSSSGFKSQISPLVTWEDEPGWDEVFITKKADISKIERLSNNKVFIEVRYEILGNLGGNDNLCILDLTEVIEFILIKEKGRWKINEPIFPPHASPMAVIANLESLVSDSEKIGDKIRVKKLNDLIRWIKETEAKK